MKLQIPFWLLALLIVGVMVMAIYTSPHAVKPIPYEPPPSDKEIILLLTNHECFRVEGGKVLLFNLSTQEWNTIKRFQQPSTNGWLWITK